MWSLLPYFSNLPASATSNLSCFISPSSMEFMQVKKTDTKEQPKKCKLGRKSRSLDGLAPNRWMRAMLFAVRLVFDSRVCPIFFYQFDGPYMSFITSVTLKLKTKSCVHLLANASLLSLKIHLSYCNEMS